MGMVQKIKKLLYKKDEDIVLDLYIKDYDKSNFYFALVFNKKIEKFKVLYVPLDAIENDNCIEEYFCYQFVFLYTVNYLLEIINANQDFCSSSNLDRAIGTMDSYYIEINLYSSDEKAYKLTFTQFIDKDFKFLFEIVVALFEHLPNIVSELGKKILSEFNENSSLVKYTGSFEFDLENDSLTDLFSKKVIDNCRYNLDDIRFIETVGNRTYAVLNEELVVIDFIRNSNSINISANFDTYGEEIYVILKAMKSNISRPFYRLMVCNNDRDDEVKEYYLCYGINNDKFEFVNSKDEVSLNILTKKNVKVLEADDYFEETVRNYLSKTYVSKKVDELIKKIIIGKREN